MALLALVSVERPDRPPEQWSLKFALPDWILADDKALCIEIAPNGEAVRLKTDSGLEAVAMVPTDCAPLDAENACCKVRRKKSQLEISWPLVVDEIDASHANTSETQAVASVETEVVQTLPQAKPPEQSTKDQGATRASLDYSRFAGIGDDVPEVAPWPQLDNAPPKVIPAVSAAASKPACRRPLAVDYSRFEDVNEEDATMTLDELEELWRHQAQLQRMRGETPEEFTTWQKRRSRSAKEDGGCADGRGLWCRTNMETSFVDEAKRISAELRRTKEVPLCSAPDLVSALASAPDATVHDICARARSRLKDELVKACATDRWTGGKDKDIRVDAIVHGVDVGDGNSGVVMEGGQFLIAYRFLVNVSYCVAVSERPVSNEPAVEAKYMGDIVISELVSGISTTASELQQTLTQRMKTSLRDPKPPKRHLSAMRPVLERLELSVAYFILRFDQDLLRDRITS